MLSGSKGSCSANSLNNLKACYNSNVRPDQWSRVREWLPWLHPWRRSRWIGRELQGYAWPCSHPGWRSFGSRQRLTPHSVGPLHPLRCRCYQLCFVPEHIHLVGRTGDGRVCEPTGEKAKRKTKHIPIGSLQKVLIGHHFVSRCADAILTAQPSKVS